MKKVLGVLVLGVVAAACGGKTKSKSPTACREVIDAKKAIKEVSDALPAWSTDDVASMHATKYLTDGTTPATPDHTRYAGTYRDDLATHPGCARRSAYDGKLFLNWLDEVAVASGIPVQNTNPAAAGYLPGYACAAKLYDMPVGVSEDATKPIVILVHGNSSSPNSWEEYKNSTLTDQDATREGTQLKPFTSGFEFTLDAQTREMLASKLVADGYRVYAADFRTDKTLALVGANLAAGATEHEYGDAIGNVDHGWAVPLVQALIKAVMEANPDRKVSLVGHSLGASTVQDALRRLFKQYKSGGSTLNPYAHLEDVVLASGALHGVAGSGSTPAGPGACEWCFTMRGTVNCEMGDRTNYVPTAFGMAINGPKDLFSVPCADGSFAFGQDEQCDSNVVQYTTITMRDAVGGTLQDEFVSEAAARLDMDKVSLDANGTRKVEDAACVDNHLIELTDFDSSGFFMDVSTIYGQLNGFLANHFGTIRSNPGMDYILERLAD